MVSEVDEQDSIFFVDVGDIDDEVDAYTAVEGINVVTLRVNDSTQHEARSLTEILGTAGASDTFYVTNSPIDTLSSVTDLQTGSAYIPAVSSNRDSITVRTVRDKTLAGTDT